MELRELLKKLVASYFIIYGCAFFGTWIYCSIFCPQDVFGLDYFMDMAFFSLMGDLPSLIFYSRRELSQTQWNIRQVIHLIMLEAVLLALARYLNMYRTLLQGIVFAGIIFCVYIVVRGICFAQDFRTAKALNDKLKEMKNAGR